MVLDCFCPLFCSFFFLRFYIVLRPFQFPANFFIGFPFFSRFSGRRKTEKFLSRSATCDVRIYFVLMKQQQRTVLPVLLVGHCMCNIIVDHENIWHFPSKKKPTEREACAFCFCFPLAFHNNAKPISFVFSKNLHMPNQWFVQICRPAHKKHLPRKGHIRF